MKFLYLGNRVLLKGLHPKGSVFSEIDRFFNDSATRKRLVLQILAVTPTSIDEPLLPAALSDLLDQFSKVFDFIFRSQKLKRLYMSCLNLVPFNLAKVHFPHLCYLLGRLMGVGGCALIIRL